MLLTDLDLIRLSSDEKQYSFNIDGKHQLPVEILLYAIVKEKGDTDNVDYDTLQLIGNVFCLNDMELINMLMALQVKFPNIFRYTDTAGLRQVHFLKSLKPNEVLKYYYKMKNYSPSANIESGVQVMKNMSSHLMHRK